MWLNASDQEIREFVYTYDSVGNLLTVADKSIDPSTHARTTASDTLQFVYDDLDQLQLERDVNPLVGVSTVLDRNYNTRGLETAVSANLGGVIVGENVSGGVKDFVNQYAYDALGRLTSVTQTNQSGGNSVAPKLATFQYDVASQLTDLRRYSSTVRTPRISKYTRATDTTARAACRASRIPKRRLPRARCGMARPPCLHPCRTASCWPGIIWRTIKTIG